MDWYYVEDGKQTGPVAEPRVQELVRDGKITAATLVWSDGMAQWQAYGTIANPPVPVASGGEWETCVSCGKSFPSSELIRYENSSICAACKPTFFQRVKEGLAGSSRLVWRSKKAVVMGIDGSLPDRCVKCNGRTEGNPLVKTLYWHPPWVYLLLLLPGRLIIYIIVAVIVRKKAIVRIGFCDKHRSARIWAIAISWALLVGGIAVIIAAVAETKYPTMAVGVVLGGLMTLGGIFYGAIKGRALYATRIDKEYVWMKGFCKAYLDELPEWLSGGPVEKKEAGI